MKEGEQLSFLSQMQFSSGHPQTNNDPVEQHVSKIRLPWALCETPASTHC